MNKNKDLLKIIGLFALLLILVAAILYVAIAGLDLGIVNVVSVAGIPAGKDEVETKRLELSRAESQYEVNLQSLEKAKKDFDKQKKDYELISDETIKAIKEATKEEEYFIEYLWITLGNYAYSHDLSLAIIEPDGTVSQNTTSTKVEQLDDTTVSTGTGVTGNTEGVKSTNNAATTGSPTSGTQKGGTEETEKEEVSVTKGLTASAGDLSVQVKGSYIDVADFVFEVENDKSLRFKLDNIKMEAAEEKNILASFKVKDFRVLKSLQ